jgi:cytochrome c5
VASASRNFGLSDSRTAHVVVSLVLGFSSLAAPSLAQELLDGPEKATVVRVCSTCHSTDTIQGRHQDKAAWTDTVFKMVDLGAETTKDERAEIVTCRWRILSCAANPGKWR